MLLCIDTHYFASGARVAGLVFRDIAADRIVKKHIRETKNIAPYQPGLFYRRELPGILELLKQVDEALHTIIIDGYVWLSGDGNPGLGGHLFNSLEGRIRVIGVAKSSYRDVSMACRVLRGNSRRPLFVTAAGMQCTEAAHLISRMHGPHRLPTLLKRVDAIARQTGTHHG